MPSVFISHSSLDKPFVRRLAVDLLNEGFPVWFDSWELDLGDSLPNRISESLETASLVLMVVSAHSLRSKWVDYETEAALTLEGKRKSTILVPLLIDETETPARLKDRMHASFRDAQSYGTGLDQLTDFLRARGLDQVPQDPAHALVPLVLHGTVHLDGVRLERRVAQLRAHQPGLVLKPNQFVMLGDDLYQQLRTRMVDRMTHISSDPYFSPDFLSRFSSDYDSLIKTERRFLSHLAVLVSEIPHLNRLSLKDVAYWYVRERLSHLLYYFWMVQRPGPDAIPRDPAWRDWLVTKSDAQTFYDVPRLQSLAVWTQAKAPGEPTASGVFLVPEETGVVRFLQSLLPHLVSEPLNAWGDADLLFSKYIVPAAFARSPLSEARPFLDPERCLAGTA
ncbi:MAG: toll/interleukin-1 receptor domain-containing protein [Verrucomicrobiales bacterium]|nr:toll/interleukin-1 receptor domain-containing protein [Verrucomicrobiales bacterium]